MASDSDDVELQRDLDKVKQRSEMLRQHIYLTILQASPNAGARLIAEAPRFLRKIDAMETKRLKALREAYTTEA